MWKGRGTGTLLLKERPKLHLQVKIVLLLVIQGSATRLTNGFPIITRDLCIENLVNPG